VPKPTISRRAFIRLALLGGIGAGAVVIERRTAGIGLLNFLRWMIRGQLQRFRPPAVVGLGQCTTYSEDVLPVLRDLWKICDMPNVQGKNVLVKPNMLDVIDQDIATTHPVIVAAVLDLLKELGAGIIEVGDGSAFRRDTNSVAKSCGLSSVLDVRNIPFIDLNYDELVSVKLRDGWIRNTDMLWLPKHVSQADLIVSVPKLKAHHWAGVTLSLKNLLGVIPGSRYGWAKNIIHINGINSTILGLYESLPPVISIVDGIIGMEGNGPLWGKPVDHGLLAMGRDPLAVDITCAMLMGFSIDSIPHLSGAAIAGIGQAQKIITRGVPPNQLQRHYEAPPKI
jgi:uncharacterized protein (DUF362 family)